MMNRVIVTVIILLVLFQCHGNDNKNLTNKKREGKTMHLLPLRYEDFWEEPELKIVDFTRALLEEEEENLIISCPHYIPLSLRKSFPVVMVGCRNKAIYYKKRFKGKTIGICNNLETGSSFIGYVLLPPDIVSELPLSPGFVVENFVIDLRKMIGIPWNVGTYKIWFVYYDLISNGILCRLSKDEKSYGSKEEEKYLKEVILNTPRRGVTISDAIVYTKEFPSVISNCSIDIKVDEIGKEEGPIAKVIGNIPILPNQKVEIKEEKDNLEGIKAVVPVEILIVDTKDKYLHISLGIPCYKVVEEKEKYGIFQFEVNLSKLDGIKIEKGNKFFIYAFCGEFAAGPAIIDVDNRNDK
ncbi:MAG: hypothetical protein N2053_03480 [Chitinispirillaceae bacterium]|nr:hypothetical protein [Chitinispirillaceae bacterium]